MQFERRTRRSHGNIWTFMWWFSKCLHHKMSIWTLKAHWEASALSSRGPIMVSPSCLPRAAQTVRKATEDTETPEFNLWDHSATWKIQVQLNQREALKTWFWGKERNFNHLYPDDSIALGKEPKALLMPEKSIGSRLQKNDISGFILSVIASFCFSALSCTSGPLYSPLIV